MIIKPLLHYGMVLMNSWFSLGLTNAPFIFQKLMNNIFIDMLDESLVVYLDNLPVFSTGMESHSNDICKALE